MTDPILILVSGAFPSDRATLLRALTACGSSGVLVVSSFPDPPPPPVPVIDAAYFLNVARPFIDYSPPYIPTEKEERRSKQAFWRNLPKYNKRRRR